MIEKYLYALEKENFTLKGLHDDDNTTRLTYRLKTSSPRTIGIIMSLNIPKEGSNKKDKKTAKKFKIKFKSEYDFNMSRWSEPQNVKPIFYIDDISCSNEEDFNKALNRILDAKERLYNRFR